MKTKNKIQHLILAGLLGTTIASQGAVIYTHTYGLNATDVDGGALDSATETWTHNVTNIDGSGVSFDLVLTVAANGNLTSLSGMGIFTGSGNNFVEPGDSATFSLAIENLVGIDVSKLYYAMTIHGLHTNAKGGTDSGTFTLINGVAPSSTLTWTDSNGGSDFTGHTGSFNLPLMNAAYGDGSDVTSFTHAGAGAAWTFFSQGVEFAVVPEPSSTALLGLGGLALMLRRKRS